MFFWVATQVLRACKVSTTPPKSKIIVTKVAPRSFLLPVCCRHDTGWVATDFGICCNCCLINIAVRRNHSDIIAHGSHRLHGFFACAIGAIRVS